MKTLIVYDSKHGTTEEVAKSIATAVKVGGGGAVSLLNLRTQGAVKFSLADYDSVALGAPFYMGRWSRRALAFASAYEATLALKALGVFAVGSNAELGDKAAVAALPSSLATAVSASAYFGGRFDYARLGFFERLIVKAVSGKAESSSTLDMRPAEGFGKTLAAAAKGGARPSLN